jgi:hypothetical protein
MPHTITPGEVSEIGRLGGLTANSKLFNEPRFTVDTITGRFLY